jgi:hypothetical protein
MNQQTIDALIAVLIWGLAAVLVAIGCPGVI